MDMPQPDGSLQKISRRPILHKDAIPCLPPSCPKYLSSPSPKPERLDRGKIESKLFFQALEQSLDLHKAEDSKFGVKSLGELKCKLEEFELPSPWLYQNIQIPLTIHNFSDIREIDTIFSEVSANTKDPVENCIRQATSNIESMISKIGTSNDMLKKYSELLPQLKSLLGQLEDTLIPKNRKRYNIVTMVLGLKSHLISSTCYSYLQSLNCLIFPHSTTLRSLYGSIGLECELQTYLEASTANINNQERNVTLHMDEIHVKSEFSYTGGRIFGSSTTQNEAANTVLAFMIPSLCKKWSTVVRLLPCANLQLLKYPLNANLFKLLSPIPNLETCVLHPLDICRPLYLIFDFVHIIKTVRNNWINQIDSNHKFSCPSSVSCKYTLKVPFQDFRNLFKLEQKSVAKTAHQLTAKICWPSSLERQNLNLALRLFDDSTTAVLTVHASKYVQVSETAQFISLVCKVWKIFNINRPNKEIRLNDELSMSLQSNDIRFIFLSDLVKWLDEWRTLPQKHGNSLYKPLPVFAIRVLSLKG
ncbi:Transposable element P transposase [Oopsacas minuta]|uniref:Transposable element P transposase n=1 Tax=Oopsacas minuta TaxID=111878 RepID=A0AAV7K4G0_9METZ|nr:Transposable element P transposase [Oopsacas minuta]